MSLNARTIGSLLNWMQHSLPVVMWRKGVHLPVYVCNIYWIFHQFKEAQASEGVSQQT